MVVWCAFLLSNHPESLFFFVLLFWDQLCWQRVCHTACIHIIHLLREIGAENQILFMSLKPRFTYMQFVSNQISAQAQGLWV